MYIRAHVYVCTYMYIPFPNPNLLAIVRLAKRQELILLEEFRRIRMEMREEIKTIKRTANDTYMRTKDTWPR